MPQILIQNKRFTVLLTITLFSFCCMTSHAQCVLKKIRKGSSIITETPETYIYKRDNADYNALSLIFRKIEKAGATAITIRLKYSFSAFSRKAGMLNLTFKDGVIIRLPLRFINAIPTDNRNIHVNSYEAVLSDNLVDKLIANPVTEASVSSDVNFKFSETFTFDETLFMQTLRCLKDTSL